MAGSYIPAAYQRGETFEDELTDAYQEGETFEDELTDAYQEGETFEDELTDAYQEGETFEDELTDVPPIKPASDEISTHLPAPQVSKEACNARPRPPAASLLLRALRPHSSKHLTLGAQADTKQELGVVTLSGFSAGHLNGDYMEQVGTFRCHDRPTYWSACSRKFLYYNTPSKTWTLAPWKAWADVKRTGDGRHFACSHQGMRLKDRVQEWCEYLPEGRKPIQVSAQFRKKDVLVESRPQTLLSTLPGAEALLHTCGAMERQPPSITELLGICRLLRELPSDGGWLANQLATSWTLEGLDLEFVLLCKDALSRAARIRQEFQIRRAWLQEQRAREEALSRKAAEELGKLQRAQTTSPLT